MLPVVAPQPFRPADAPEGRRLEGAEAAGVLVLLVDAAEGADLQVVLAEHLRVVVPQDEEVLVVPEGRLVPERLP